MNRIEKIAADWKRERPDLDATDAATIGRFLMVARQLERVGRAELAPFDLGLTDHDVLSALRRSGSPYALKPGELLEELVLTSGALSSCLDRLESRGLVARRRDENDGRARIVTLTEAGIGLIDAVVEARYAAASEVLRNISASAKRQLNEVMAQIEIGAERAERNQSRTDQSTSGRASKAGRAKR
ncbi:MAG: MarR family transcriptional regulator [Wenzhouxiangella sp.]|jgi:DNA-binding MarR family transcriptional regulator|nr:MarR family transcriptional regulator [Wenzhouxiangella sp.]